MNRLVSIKRIAVLTFVFGIASLFAMENKNPQKPASGLTAKKKRKSEWVYREYPDDLRIVVAGKLPRNVSRVGESNTFRMPKGTNQDLVEKELKFKLIQTFK